MNAREKSGSASLPEFPYDTELLKASRLYRSSRELFVEGGGVFHARLVSASRTLSSAILVENEIEYTPLASELKWAATDRIERRSPQTLEGLKRFVSSVYHEQNHRVLWRLLPPAPEKPATLRRYLNFAESLVIAADMALGDELGEKRAGFYHGVGIIYDPGTSARADASSPRVYRNYLQACAYATYLNLEGFDPRLIRRIILALYANAGELASRAAARAGNLNRGFITQTNLVWQRRHRKRVIEKLGRAREDGTPPLELSVDPVRNVEQYVLTEKWFERLGL